MNPRIPGLDHTWKVLCILLLFVVGAEAWYLRVLSEKANEQRIAQSASLDRHLADQYLIAKLRREARACAKAGHSQNAFSPKK